MSWIIDKMRVAVGVIPPPEEPKGENKVAKQAKKVANEKTYEERAAIMIKTEKLKIKQKELELEDVGTQLAQAKEEENWTRYKALRPKEMTIQKELDTMRAQLRNIEQQKQSIEKAKTNVSQAYILKDGATEMQQAAAAMEDIDLDEVVDQVQESAATINEHSEILSSPNMFPNALDVSATGEEFLIDEEIERLKQEIADAKAADMPVAGGGGGGSGGNTKVKAKPAAATGK